MHSDTSQLHYHFDFHSENLDNKRTISVWLPPQYNPDSTYPVLYLHDGQNMFDKRYAAYGAIWEADKTAERLIRQGFLRPLILVGVDTIFNAKKNTLCNGMLERSVGGMPEIMESS